MPSPTAEVGVAAHIAEVGPGGNAGPRVAEHADWACRRALGFERGGCKPSGQAGETGRAWARTAWFARAHATAAHLDAHPHRLCCFARAQATPWRTPTSSGSSTAAFGSWSTRWLPHMSERWCAQPPPPTHHQRLHPTPTGGRYSGACRSARDRRPMQRRRDDRRLGAVHASQGSLWRTRPVAHGRSRTVLAMATACLRLGVCRVSPVHSLRVHGVIIATAVRSERSISVTYLLTITCACRMDPKHLNDARYA